MQVGCWLLNSTLASTLSRWSVCMGSHEGLLGQGHLPSPRSLYWAIRGLSSLWVTSTSAPMSFQVLMRGGRQATVQHKPLLHLDGISPFFPPAKGQQNVIKFGCHWWQHLFALKFWWLTCSMTMLTCFCCCAPQHWEREAQDFDLATFQPNSMGRNPDCWLAAPLWRCDLPTFDGGHSNHEIFCHFFWGIFGWFCPRLPGLCQLHTVGVHNGLDLPT